MSVRLCTFNVVMRVLMYRSRSGDKGSVRVTLGFFLVSMCPEIDDALIREFEPSYKNNGTTGVLWHCKVPLGDILVPLGYYCKKSKPVSP
jgi:hypothetical protein